MKEIELTQGKVALVSDCDYEWLLPYNWYASHEVRKWYAMRTDWIGKNKNVRMHRFILGVTDSTVEVDHIDGDGLNNQRENLRIATRLQNSWNMKIGLRNTSGYKGIYFNKRARLWIPRIKVNGVQLCLKTYHTAEEAARAYDLAAIEFHGEFARTNFPKEDYLKE